MPKNSSEYMREYYQRNKQKWEKQKSIIECECGATCQKVNYASHCRTRKHREYIRDSEIEKIDIDKIMNKVVDLLTKQYKLEDNSNALGK